MAYFPNGTSGEIFQNENCAYCSQWKDREEYPGEGEGCPVYDVHFLGDYQNEDVAPLLDLLIQDDEKRGPICNLFTPENEAAALEREGQQRLPGSPS